MTQPAENLWHLRLAADPFVASFRDVRLDCGTSLAKAVEPFDVPDEQIALLIDGVAVPRGVWPMVRPKPGVLVHARAVPGGPAALAIGGLASWWGSTAFTVFGAAITWGQIAGVALTFAFQALATSLFAPEAPSFERKEAKPVYSISDARNEQNPWGAIPIVMGRHRVAPVMGASPYTEILGGEQYLRMLLLWGPGPVSISDIRIGNTPISDFEGVTLEHDLDGSATRMALYPARVAQENVGITMDPLTPYERTSEADTDELAYTLVFPNGLIRYRDSDGFDKPHSVLINGYYREAGSGDPWTLLPDMANRTIERETTTPFFVAGRTKMPSNGQWEIRFQRGQAGDGDNTYVEDVQWLNFKSITYGSAVNLPGVAKSVVRIKASEQLNSAVDRVNAIVQRQVNIWNGSDWTTTGYSSNPAAMFRDVCKGPGNARPQATDDAVLGVWYEFCASKGFLYEDYYVDQAPIRERLSDIAAAGMASPHRASGKMGVVIDWHKSTVVQHITPRNSWGFSGAIDYPDQPHALRVQFNNRQANYEPDEIIVYDDGYTAANATAFDVIRPAGVTHWAYAHLMGRHFLASGRLRPERWTVSMDFENLVATRGDLVRFTHDVALIGQASGRIKAISGSDVTLDEYCTFESGKTYTLRVRGDDGSSVSATATGTGSTKTITVSDATGMSVGDLAMFGEMSQESVLALVQDIQHATDLQATLTLIPYNEDVYNSWNAIPEYTPTISSPVGLMLKGPATPELLYLASDEAALPKDFSGSPLPTILAGLAPGEAPVGNSKVTPTAGFRFGYRRSGVGESFTYVPVGLDGIVRIPGVEARQAYDLRAYAYDVEGNTSVAVEENGYVVVGLSAPPPSVDTLRMSTRSGQAYLEWTYPSIVGDVVRYELREHHNPDVTDWSTMTILASDIPRDARSFMVPSTTGSFAIKPVDALGIKSAAATYVTSNVTDPAQTNVVLMHSAEDDDFSGEKDSVAFLDGRLQLVDGYLVDDWPVLDDIPSVNFPSGTDQVDAEGFYSIWAPQDIGAVYTVDVRRQVGMIGRDSRDAVNKWANVNLVNNVNSITATGDEYGVEVQIRYSRDDVASGMTWTDWETFVPGSYTARHFDFRARLWTVDGYVTPALDHLFVSIDVPDRTDRGEDVAVGSGGTTITFAVPFMAKPNLTLRLQDAASGDYADVTGLDEAGFDITIRNSGGTGVARTIDWQALGYGRAVA